ncbi:MAG: diacylglycerol kinase family lipid kinase [Chloroflexi bacterium]|nr:diacylglycerol kinase family lipid kinase [Chloroflexota bacterium]
MVREEMKLIVNPVAANGAVGKNWPRIRDFLQAEGASFDAVLTDEPGHAIQLARQALDDGYRIIVAVGGDGTVNEVLNGLVMEGAVDPEVALGIIPWGTGADFSRTAGIPRHYVEAGRKLLRLETRPVDLGRIICLREGREVERYFINAAGLGFDGEVADLVNRNPKLLGGTIPYLACLFTSLVTYRNKNVELSFDGQRVRGRINSVIVCNGRYLGGGMFMAPGAAFDDGMFDVVILGNLNKLEVVVNLPRLYKGTHLTHPKVSFCHAREVHVEARERMFLQAEGELIGEAPATFQIIPRALRVLV